MAPPDLSTLKRRQALALLKMGADSPKLACQMAEERPNYALVETLWKVTCTLWTGELYNGYTSDEECSKECRETFGWTVVEEKGWTYKYSKTPDENDELFVWIAPPEPRHMTWDFTIEAEKKWEKCFIQKRLWWAMELRRPFLHSNKTGSLDMKTLVLPKEHATHLVKCLGPGDGGLPEDVKKWVKDCAA